MLVAYRLTCWPTVRQQLAFDISTEISAKCRSRYWPISQLICHLICWPTHLDQYIGWVSVEQWLICRPTLDQYADRYIGWGVHKIHMIWLTYRLYPNQWWSVWLTDKQSLSLSGQPTVTGGRLIVGRQRDWLHDWWATGLTWFLLLLESLVFK